MAFLLNLLSKKAVAPDRVPTDTIVPLHALDDQQSFRSMSIHLSMQFDDVLDVQKLVDALKKVLEKPGWGKLGARLRLKADGRLEYHVPAQYTESRPAVRFTHATHDMPISSHPLASQLPRPDGSLYITPKMEPFKSLLTPLDGPGKIDDWTYADLPQLQLHVVSFSDATLVTLTWLHTLLDALGAKALLEAWTTMLEGRESDIPEVYGHNVDPLAALGAQNSPKLEAEDVMEEEEYVLKGKEVKGWRFLTFVLAFIWELLVYRKEEIHQVCVPPAFLQRLRQQAIRDLSSASPEQIVMDNSDLSASKPFLSDGDVLAAWWTRLIISCNPWAATAKPTKTIAFYNVFNMRDLLQNTEPKLLPKGAAYISNCAAAIISLFSLHELLSSPLGIVAARIRKDLVTQSARPQMNACIRHVKASLASGGQPPLYGTSDMVISALSNWAKAKMFETDFSAAVVKEGTVKHRRGKPTYIQADGTTKNFSIRNMGTCIGRDGDGNYWIAASLRTKTWRNVMKAVEGMK